MTGPVSAAEQTEQRDTPSSGTTSPATAANVASGHIFSNVTHTLADQEITSLPVVKLILDRMYRAEAKRDEFEKYVPLYHEADKSVAVLNEKLNTNTMVDIFYGTGLALGGAAAGFVPYFWDKDHILPTVICASFAFILVVVAVLVRIYGPKK